jgi:hypothetical protein
MLKEIMEYQYQPLIRQAPVSQLVHLKVARQHLKKPHLIIQGHRKEEHIHNKFNHKIHMVQIQLQNNKKQQMLLRENQTQQLILELGGRRREEETLMMI